MQIRGKIIWLTGASSGIGAALAVALCDEAETLVISARREDALVRVKASCRYPDRVVILPLDLSDTSSFDACVQEVIFRMGRIDILINNAGLSQRSLARETSEAVDRRIMEVNYFGNILLAKKLLPHLLTQDSSLIVALSSLSGHFGFFERSAYAASKHALHGFYESLRLEESANGLSVLLVSPSFVDTQISASALLGDGQTHQEEDRRLRKGMTAQQCAQQIVKAMKHNRKSVVIGAKGSFAVFLSHMFPNFFYHLMKNKGTNP